MRKNIPVDLLAKQLYSLVYFLKRVRTVFKILAQDWIDCTAKTKLICRPDFLENYLAVLTEIYRGYAKARFFTEWQDSFKKILSLLQKKVRQ